MFLWPYLISQKAEYANNSEFKNCIKMGKSSFPLIKISRSGIKMEHFELGLCSTVSNSFRRGGGRRGCKKVFDSINKE